MSDDIPKQRGIYSEILTTEDTENLKLVSTIGPAKNNLIEANKKQRIPRARGRYNSKSWPQEAFHSSAFVLTFVVLQALAPSSLSLPPSRRPSVPSARVKRSESSARTTTGTRRSTGASTPRREKAWRIQTQR